MTRLSINMLRWSSSWVEVERCLQAVLDSELEDFELIYTENEHPTLPSLMEEVQRRFGGDSRLRTVRNLTNLGYAGAHNQFFCHSSSELVMVLNPDAVLDRAFLTEIIQAFADPKVAAATGKMLKPGGDVLDGTGIELQRNRRSFERGQLEIDQGQYDNNRTVFGVSGTAAVYRRSALEAVRLEDDEYFDADFFAYHEDLDLSWRLRLQGYTCAYVPEAIVEHPRAVGTSPHGLRNLATFIRHHRSHSLLIRRLSWRNKLFAIVKNDFGKGFYRDFAAILAREIGILLFIVLFTPDTLPSVFTACRLLPRMLRKRSLIQARRTITSAAAGQMFC